MNNGRQWLDEFAKGSEEAFGKFVRQYASLVYSIARRRLGNEAAAEEAAQLVFIRVARSRLKFASEGKLVAWLHRTATNVAIDLWRAEARRKAREAEALFMQQHLADEDLEALAKQLDEAIDGLEEKEREAILLRFFASQRMAEVGSALGISEDAAKMRVSRAVGSLRKKLGKVGVACGEAALLGFLSNRILEAAPMNMVEAWVKSSPGVGRGGASWAPRRVGIVAGSALVLMLAFYSAKTFLRDGASATIAQGEQINRPAAINLPEEVSSNRVAAATVRHKMTLLNGETREPVAGAMVRVEYFDRGQRTEMLRVVSGLDGVAEVPQRPMHLTARASIFAEGYLPISAHFSGPLPLEATAHLDVGRLFSGRVLSEEGEPVPGVLIRVRCGNIGVGAIGGTAASLAYSENEAAILSDAGGEWVLPFVPKWWSDTSLILMKEGFALTPVTFPSRDADATRVDITIKRGVMIKGQVLDEEQKPVAGALIRLLWPQDMYDPRRQVDLSGRFAVVGRVVQSDAEGRFQIEKVCSFELDGKVRLEGEAEGRVRQQQTVGMDTNMVIFGLSRAYVLRGVILDRDGKPFTNAWLSVQGGFRGGCGTDENGRFEWKAAPLEATYHIDAPPVELPGEKFLLYRPKEITLRADGTEKEIRMTEVFRN